MSEEPKVERSIADELGKLGQQVANAAKAAWSSEERRKLQAELTRGVEKLSQELNAVLSEAAQRDEIKELRARAEKVAAEAREADVVEDIRKGILNGLEALNRELGRLVEKLEAAPAAPSAVETVEAAGEQAAEAVEKVAEAVADAAKDLVEPKAE